MGFWINKQAIKYFAASQIEIKFGGNHSFEGFEDYFSKIKISPIKHL